MGREAMEGRVLSSQEDKEAKAYEEISGVICGYNLSCGFYVDWLQSITGAA
jgi:hypothetical protein